MAHAESVGRIYCVVGDSLGGIHAFFVPPYQVEVESMDGSHICSYTNAHSSERVSSMILDKDSNRDVLSSGRDGHVCRFQLVPKGHHMGKEVYYLHRVSAGKASKRMSVVDRLIPIGENGEVYLYGFYGKRMILRSLLNRTEILNIDCGGINRTMDFACSLSTSTSPLAFTFSYVYKGELCIHSSLHSQQVKTVGGQILSSTASFPQAAKAYSPYSNSYAVLRPSLHGLRINDLMFLQSNGISVVYYLV